MATETTWTGGSGNWNDTSHWKEGVPGPGAAAIIAPPVAPDVTVSAVASAASISMTSGILAVSAPLTVGGAIDLYSALDQSGGTITVNANSAGESLLQGGFVQTGGTLQVGSGSLDVAHKGGTISGTISGAGGLYCLGGTTMLNASARITVPTWQVGTSYGGTLALGGDNSYAGTFRLINASIDPDGHIFNLAGPASLGGVIQTPGTVKISGAASIAVSLAGGTAQQFAELDIAPTGTAIQSGNIGVGVDGMINIEKGGTYQLDGAYVDTGTLIGTDNKTSFVNNAGLLEKGVNDVSTIVPDFTNSGTVLVPVGQMQFIGRAYNEGTMSATGKGSTLTFNNKSDTLQGMGSIHAARGGIIDLNTIVPASQAIVFDDNTGTLKLQEPLDFKGIISGLTVGDMIDLVSKQVTSLSYANGTLMAFDTHPISGTVEVAALTIGGHFNSSNFGFASDAQGGTDIFLHT